MLENVAVFVDGENVSATHAPAIRKIADCFGTVSVQRVYGDVTRLPRWCEVAGFRAVHSGTGKNAADMILAIQAVGLAHTHRLGTVVLASSDRDFTHLATYLRERGVEVVGIGEEKAPEAFREACTIFRQIGAGDGACAPGISAMDRNIRAIIAAGSEKGRGIRIVNLGQEMRARHGTIISQTPDKNWRGYLNARPALYDLDPKGPEARVRFRPDGFSQPPA